MDEWQTLYPAVDVLQQLRSMRGWLLGVMVLFPALWWGVRYLWPRPSATLEPVLTLAAVLGMLAAATAAGKRYE